MAKIIAFRVEDVVRLRKPHPCGGFEWGIHRLGADIGLQCRTCGHYVMLPRATLERRLKRFVSRGPELDDAPEADGEPALGDNGLHLS